jgi:adenylylsulfate kinase-like enzyme
MRDPKGLYAKARHGELNNFTGLGSGYEPPVDPEVHLRTDALAAEDCANLVIRRVMRAEG